MLDLDAFKNFLTAHRTPMIDDTLEFISNLSDTMLMSERMTLMST